MGQTAIESLWAFLKAGDVPERSLVVANREEPEQVQRLFEEAFGSLKVDIEELEVPSEATNVVVLVENGEVVATSPLKAVQNAVLFVNVDLYKTGLSGIDKYEAPDVITELDEMVFTLRGFPASTKEKLLLVVMSRFIEQRALKVGDGRLDAAFQKLSRIEDEYGTRVVYNRLSETEVDVHVYGIGDSIPQQPGITVHADDGELYRRSWFVVFTPDDPNEEPAALLALETDDNTWKAMWTYDPERIERLQQHIIENF